MSVVHEYECTECGEITEVQQDIKDPILPGTVCKKCNGYAKKIVSRSHFVLRGTGWPGKNNKAGIDW